MFKHDIQFKPVSIGTMLEQLHGLLGMNDLTTWEHGFVTSVYEKYLRDKKSTAGLSGKQVETIQSIWEKHFS